VETEPLPHDDIEARPKLIAEAGLTKIKNFLGWLIDFRRMTIALPDNKFHAYSIAISEMLNGDVHQKESWKQTSNNGSILDKSFLPSTISSADCVFSSKKQRTGGRSQSTNSAKRIYISYSS
jgi:hypothetical protein